MRGLGAWIAGKLGGSRTGAGRQRREALLRTGSGAGSDARRLAERIRQVERELDMIEGHAANG